MPRIMYEVSVLKLSGDLARDKHMLSAHYSIGWLLVQVITYFPGNHQAILHRPVDQLANFENKNGNSILKTSGPPPPLPRHGRRAVSS